MIKSSNNIKNKNTCNIENKINKLIYIKLSKINEKAIVLDSKLPIHVIKGNNIWSNKRNTILALSKTINPNLKLPFICNDHGINEK